MPELLATQLVGRSRLVFDLDGTLYDARDYERPAMFAVAQWLRTESSRDLPAIEFQLWQRREADRNEPRLFNKVLAEYSLPEAWVVDCVRVFRSYGGGELGAVPSLAGVLHELSTGGSRLALVTNGHPPVQRRKLQELQLGHLFDVCLFCDVQHPEQLKPSRWAWEQLAEWLGGRRATYVGDAPVDEQFAAVGGADFVQFLFRNSCYGD